MPSGSADVGSGMALVHRAALAPSEQELVASWLPTRSWAAGHEVVDKLGEYRVGSGEPHVLALLRAER